MIVREWSGHIRLAMGFLVAPVIAPVCSLILLIAIADARDVDCPALLSMTAGGIAYAGSIAAYACAAFVGLPYVLLVRKRGELNFRTLMAPVLGLILPLFLLLFVLGMTVHAAAGMAALLPLPGVVLSVVCFYFLSVWKCG